jgi:CheY-like chemotaxis protein
MEFYPIMIIDDDVEDLEFLQDAFIDCGVSNIVCFTRVPDALNHLHSIDDAGKLPALIICDMKMPVISGLNFLSKVKAIERFKHIPVVLITSVLQEHERKLAQQMGADSCMQKPNSYEAFKQTALLLKEKILIQ